MALYLFVALRTLLIECVDMRDSGEGLDETTVTALTVEHWREST